MKKFLKFAAISLVIFGISFSNIPFYALTGLVDSYAKGINIVDKAWHLSHNDNVVDKFTSYRNFIEKAKVYEAYAATLQYVGGAEASGNSAAYNVSLTSLTGGAGSSAQSGDLVVVATGFVQVSNLNPGVGTAGYAEVADLYQNDTRDANLSANWKIMGGSPDTAVNCLGSGSATNGSVCVVQVWRNVDQANPLDVVSTTAQLNNSAIPNSPAITPITSGAVVISAGLGTGAAVDTSVTAPTGYGNQVDISVDPSNAATVGIASKSWSGSGAEDPAAWTTWTTTTSDSWAAVTLALRPANDPPTLTVSQPDGTGDTVTVGDLYNITYDLADTDNVVTAAMYYDADAVGLNGTAITGACATAAENPTTTCSWDTTGMTPGTYYVYGITNDGVNPQVSDYSPGVITINGPATTLTISQTAGSKVATKNSGDVNQYAHDTACTGAANCSAFTLASAGGTSNVTSIKITESGSVTANTELSDLNLYYDYDGNWADAGAETLFGTVANFAGDQTATVSGTLAISDGATAYIYARYDLANGAVYPVGGATVDFQIAAFGDVVSDATESGTGSLVGTQTVRPNVTDATDSALVDGGRNGETFTITGTGFGIACGSISVVVEGTTLTCNSANNTTISATIPSTQITTYGGTGASGLLVTVGGTADDARQTYYVYPSVNLVSTPLVSNAARELENITLTNSTANASRFGATQGTVTFSGGFGSVGATVVSWGDTSIEVTVPSAISDTVYLGDITVTRNADSKTDTAYGSNGFRVLPKITSLVNSSDSVGQPITVNGNHFCQSGSCPGVFSSANKVTFTSSVDAVVFTSWSDTVIVTEVPAGVTSGNVVVTSDTSYASNGVNFTLVSTVPNDPTNPKQYKADGTTEIAAGGTASTTSVVLKADLTAGIAINMIIQVEVEDVFTGFDGVGIVDGTVVGGGGCTGCTSLANAQVTVSGLTDNIKHWRARAKNTTTSEVSAWVYYGTSNPNETDFKIDTTAPVITGTSSGTPGTNSASITWDTSGEISTTRIEYDTAGTFTGGYDCAGTSECTALTDTSPMVNGHTPPPLSNLNSGTTYHYRVRSKDAAGNETIDPTTGDYTFLTQTETKPAKTTRFHITGQTGAITNGSPLNQTFSVFMPELATSTKSAFVEIVGVYKTTSSGQTITVQVNSETSKAYALPSASATSHFRILHQVSSVTVETANANTLYVTPETSTTVYVNSADINVNYSYTP